MTTTTTKLDPMHVVANLLAEDYAVSGVGDFVVARSGNVVARVSPEPRGELWVYIYTDYGDDGTSYIDGRYYKTPAGAVRMIRRWLG